MILNITIIIAVVLIVILVALLLQETKVKKDVFSVAEVEEAWNGSERRRAVRFDAVLDARYKILKDGLRYGQAKTTNISGVGICMVLYERLNKDTLIEIMFESTSTNQVNIFEGRVIWIEEIDREPDTQRRRFRTGIEAMNPSEFTPFIEQLVQGEDKT